MSQKQSPENNTGMCEYLFKESIKAIRPSGVFGSCKRGKGRAGANYLCTNTELMGGERKKPNTDHTGPEQSWKEPGSVIWSSENAEK